MREPSGVDEHRLLRRGRNLQYATIVWNLLEFCVTVSLGVAAGSLALVAFGLDSLIEVFASAAVVWYIADHDASGRGRRALHAVGVAFALLAVYLAVSSVLNLVRAEHAESAPFGIAYLALAAMAMFGLSVAKSRIASAIENGPLRAEARLTFLDGCLASGILVALVANSLIGWWWADPVAALAVAFLCARESVEHLRPGAADSQSTKS